MSTTHHRPIALVTGLAAALLLLAPTFASAQARAALVRSVDEPGRVPYAEDVGGTCNAANCFFTFTTVPAGKRLVIEHAGAVARSSSTATVYSDAELLTSSSVNPSFGVRHSFRMTLLNLAGGSNIWNGYSFNGPVKAYVEAGSAPSMSVHTSTSGPTSFSQASLSGYLVDVAP